MISRMLAGLVMVAAVVLVAGRMVGSTTDAPASSGESWSSLPSAYSLAPRWMGEAVAAAAVAELPVEDVGAAATVAASWTPQPAATVTVQARVAERPIAPAVSPAGQESSSALGSVGLNPTPSATPTVIISALAPPAQLPTLITPTQVVATAGIGNGQSVNQGSLEAQVRAAVQAYFPPSEWATAMAIAYRESRYEPWAVEPGGEHFGVFQVASALHGTVPGDIDGQVAQAARLWAKAGWQPWQ